MLQLTVVMKWASRRRLASLVCRSDAFIILFVVHGNTRPMSHISAIYGTDNDQEILKSLYTIANASTLILAFHWY